MKKVNRFSKIVNHVRVAEGERERRAQINISIRTFDGVERLSMTAEGNSSPLLNGNSNERFSKQ